MRGQHRAAGDVVGDGDRRRLVPLPGDGARRRLGLRPQGRADLRQGGEVGIAQDQTDVGMSD